jgi:quercetin dioxygenase-like cupin family protein
MSLAVPGHRGLCRRRFGSNHCYTCAAEGHKMIRRFLVLLCTFAAGTIVGHFGISSIGSHLGELNVVFAQTHKPLMITHLYTGPDNQTHAEEVELKFTPGNPAEVSKMMPISSAELHRTAGGIVDDWHRAPRRQYVITLSGHGEVEVAGGKKVSMGPGHIDFVEDTTGKGHITKVVGAEDRVTLQLPLADQSGR